MTLAKRLAAATLEHFDGRADFNYPDLVRLARQILAKRPPSPSRALKGPTRKDRRREKLAKRAQEMATLRAEVISLSQGVCERCNDLVPASEVHLHHCLGGSGRRRQRQTRDNTAAVCPACHAWLHAHPKAAREWADTFLHPAF
jgi:hypothetical protein